MRLDAAAGTEAIGLWLEVDAEESAARERARQAAATAEPLPAPQLRASGSKRVLQLNFRLTAAEHAALLRAAEILGLRPTQVARLLTMRRVNQVLRETLG